LHGS